MESVIYSIATSLVLMFLNITFSERCIRLTKWNKTKYQTIQMTIVHVKCCLFKSYFYGSHDSNHLFFSDNIISRNRNTASWDSERYLLYTQPCLVSFTSHHHIHLPVLQVRKQNVLQYNHVSYYSVKSYIRKPGKSMNCYYTKSHYCIVKLRMVTMYSWNLRQGT